MLLVERRDAHEPMDAALAFEHPVRIAAVDEERDGLESRFFSRRFVDDVRGKIVRLGPAQIHAREHLRPVRRVDSAGAGMDRDDRAMRIVLAIEGRGHLQPVEPRLRVGHQALDFVRSTGIVAEHVERLARFAEIASDRRQVVHLGAHVRQVFHRFLRGRGIVPEAFRVRAPLEFGYIPRFAIVVKAAP